MQMSGDPRNQHGETSDSQYLSDCGFFKGKKRQLVSGVKVEFADFTRFASEVMVWSHFLGACLVQEILAF